MDRDRTGPRQDKECCLVNVHNGKTPIRKEQEKKTVA